MALTVPDVGEVELLNRILNISAPDNVVLHLYTNNKTPAEPDTVVEYTESEGANYAAIPLPGTGWTVNTVSNVTTAEHDQVTFTYTGEEGTIYGYYVTNAAGDTLLWAEMFSDGPYTIPGGGGSVKITPKIELE